MANEVARRDQNYVPVLTGITDDSAQEIRMLRVDPTTGRLLISDTGSSGGSSFQRPLNNTPADLGQNVFIWTDLPSVIVLDGTQSLTATQTNGSVNWTYTGSGPYTTTLAVAPNDDIFGL